MAPEEFGPVLRFLTAEIDVRSSKAVVITPFLVNNPFANGEDAVPKVARLAEFRDPECTPYKDLHDFCVCKFFSYDDILVGSAKHGSPSVVSTVCELLRLSWPHTWISKALKTLPRHRQSQYLLAVRTFASCVQHIRLPIVVSHFEYWQKVLDGLVAKLLV